MTKRTHGKREKAVRVLVFWAVFAFFVFTMGHKLMHSALWGDEWVEYRTSLKDIADGSLFEAVRETCQPPLYSILMHGWLGINDSLLWFRLFNIPVGIITGLFIFQTVRRLAGFNAGCASLLVLACSYRWVYCIQECSEYALMLMFVSGAVYFFVSALKKCETMPFLLTVIFGACAIYTQYGAVFAVIPLFVVLFFSVMLRKKIDIKKKVMVYITYVCGLVFLAFPLINNFLMVQIGNNQLIENTKIDKIGDCSDLPFVFGEMLGYFFAADGTEYLMSVYAVIGILLLALLIWTAADRKADRAKRDLSVILLLGYILHYVLVKIEFYAVTAPGIFKGFLSRYSLFYIPLMAVILPVCIAGLLAKVEESARKTVSFMIALSCSFLLFGSLLPLTANWEKSPDNRFADIWYERGAMRETTLVVGKPKDGVLYYITHHEGYEEEYLDSLVMEPDPGNLPDYFYVWNTGWGDWAMKDVLGNAEKRGMRTVYLLSGGLCGDNLIYCAPAKEFNTDPTGIISFPAINIDPTRIIKISENGK